MNITYHASVSLQKIAAVFVLVLFLAVVFFSFTTMMHGSDGGMQGDCPFSVMGVPLCPQNLEAAIIHHISAYQSFLAVFAKASVTALLLAMLVAAYAALLFSVHLFVYKPPARVRSFFHSSLAVSRDRKTIRWLSLFENSPSLA